MRRPMHELLQAVSGRLSLHMPAAQGQPLFGELDANLLETTELPVTDDLYRPSGAILEAERLLGPKRARQDVLHAARRIDRRRARDAPVCLQTR